MRISVLEKDQLPTETATRHISKARAERFIERGIAKWIKSGKILQMVKESKDIRGDIHYFRGNWLPRIKAPRRPEGLLLWYPHKSQETYA